MVAHQPERRLFLSCVSNEEPLPRRNLGHPVIRFILLDGGAAMPRHPSKRSAALANAVTFRLSPNPLREQRARSHSFAAVHVLQRSGRDLAAAQVFDAADVVKPHGFNEVILQRRIGSLHTALAISIWRDGVISIWRFQHKLPIRSLM
ncbi:hypothetical protein SPHINGO8AM_80007 [Sphingomonas sp. 8AM]|nr:hypothetical protein SPHINGO8AM_80007 [Sphingomonas sp. 8AM]